MKRLTTILFLTFYISLSINAQKEDAVLKETFLNAEFFLMNEDYKEALSNYLRLTKRGYQDNGNINYRIGQCYLKINGEKEKAIPYLEKAVKFCDAKYQEGVLKETHTPYDTYFYLGTAYRINNQFEKAIEQFEKFKSFHLDNERSSIADHEIEACKFAASQIKNQENVLTVKLGRPISTTNSDLYPVVSGNLNFMIYVSRLKFYDAIYFSKRVNNKWSAPVNITSQVQSDGDQYPTFLSYDGTELYLRKEDSFEADLMVSKKVNGSWSKAKSLGKNINSKYWEGNMSITKDGRTLYFSSNRNSGSGSLDIYKSTRLPNGDWGQPVNLGSKINTSFNEDAPYITEDGKRLYFISQGHKNMGGYDIFYCNVDANGDLSDPVHLGYPINTADDDLTFYPVKNGEMAYTSLVQKGNAGLEDIFEIYINPTTEVISLNNGTSNDIIVDTALQERPLFAMVDAEAIPSMVKPLEAPFQRSENTEEALILLPTIFFDYNSSELSENGRKSLDYIATVSKNYDDIKFELIGHTDARGSATYNQKLSEKRAMSAKNYLIGKGVLTDAISVRYSGEEASIAINQNQDGSDNSEGRKFNRRVEIRVVENKSNRKIVIEELNIPKQLKIEKP